MQITVCKHKQQSYTIINLYTCVCGAGAKVACVELPFDYISSETKGGVGGTCVLRGCVPKKLMVYASEYADDFKDSVGFG